MATNLGDCCKTEYEPIVHIQTIKNSTSRAVAEVAKYPVKMDELVNYNNEEKAIRALTILTKFLHKRRLITFGGNFDKARKSLNLEDIDTGDLINLEDEPNENFQEIKKFYLNLNLKLVAIFVNYSNQLYLKCIDTTSLLK